MKAWGLAHITRKKESDMSHKKIMKECSSKLMKDAKDYVKDAKGKKKEAKEAKSAAKDLKSRAARARN